MLVDVVLKKGESEYTIDCAIKNGGDAPAPMPPLRISLRDSDRKLIARSTLHFGEKQIIKPGVSIPCQTITLDMKRYKTLPAIAVLDIGNGFDLSLRN